jgi:myo-inositol catabolism protein IolS
MENWVETSMQYRDLGPQKIKVSAICLGTWQFSQDGRWSTDNGLLDVKEFRKIVNYAIDAGINFIDTAEEYGGGKSEEILGELLKERREEVVLATKIDVDHWDYETVSQHFQGSLDRLQTDFIDLYQIHWPKHLVRSPRAGHTYSAMTAQDCQDIHTSMMRLQEEGHITVAGLSNFRLPHLQKFPKDAFERIATNQIPYSLLWRNYDQSDLLTFCQQHGIGYLTYSSLAQGLLTGKYTPHSALTPVQKMNVLFQEPVYSRALQVVQVVQAIAADLDVTPAQVALKWVIDRPTTVSALVGIRNVTELEENVEAVSIQLKQEQIERLNQASLAFWAPMPADLELWDIINLQSNLEQLGIKPRE